MQAFCLYTRPAAKQQRGVTIIEVLVVLAIFGVLLYLGVRFFGPMRDSTQAASEQRIFMSAGENIRSSLQTQANFAAATTANAVANGWFPREMINGANIVNDWGGNITVAPANCNGVNDCYSITTVAVPADVCKATLPKLDSATRVLSATPNGGAAVAVKALGGAINFANVGAGCGTTTATIVATFGKT